MRDHGTYVRYVQGPGIDDEPGKGCRCDECRTANKLYERERASRLEPPYVDAGPARQHVEELMAAGVGMKTIAARAGVPHGTLSKLIYGDSQRNMAPSKRVRPETLAKLLTVSPRDTAEGARIPAGPTWVNIRKLVRAGVPKVRIAERIGQGGPGLQIGRRYVTTRNARAIAGMVGDLEAGRLVTDRGLGRHGRVTIAPEAKHRTRDVDPAELIESIVAVDLGHQDWRHQAACRNRPNWLWFCSETDQAAIAKAKSICNACPVSAECLDAGHNEEHGIFGGQTATERHGIRRAS